MAFPIFVPALAGIALIVAPTAAMQASPVSAEVSVAAPAPTSDEPSSARSACCTVPARTLVEIEILDRVSSKQSHSGDRFAIRLAEPLVIDGQVVAPAGTSGEGEVVHAAKARAGGKAGELILAARYLEIGGNRIPLRTFRYGKSQGKDNSAAVGIGGVAAAAVLPAAAVLGFIVSGGNVDIPAGTRATAQTAVELVLSPVATAYE